VNDRDLCMNVSSGAFECRGAAIGLLVEVHAVPARRQPLRLNTKDTPLGAAVTLTWPITWPLAPLRLLVRASGFA
jgi:hypothetical protein